MCFGNHKHKGITNVWPLLVAIKTINLFILMALQKPSSFHGGSIQILVLYTGDN